MAATLVFRLTGGSANADPNASLGGTMSNVSVSGTSLNNIFDDVLAAEAVAGDTEYRFIDLYNSGDATATNVKFSISSNSTSPDTELTAGQDATNNPHLASASLELLANESTAPASPAIVFALHPEGTELSLSNIDAGSAARICLKRVVTAGADNIASDSCTLTCTYA